MLGRRATGEERWKVSGAGKEAPAGSVRSLMPFSSADEGSSGRELEAEGGRAGVRATVRLLYVLALLSDISLGEEVVQLHKTYVEWGVIEEF